MTHINKAITPLGYRVLVEIDELEEVSKGGIIIPETREREAARTVGTLVAIGPTAWGIHEGGEPWAAVGDSILFSKYAGKRVKDPDHPERDYIIMNDEDLLCKYSKRVNEHEMAEEE